MRILILLTVLITTGISIKAQPLIQKPAEEQSKVRWMTLKEAMEKEKTEPKPLILDFYTDWCGWCKTMMKTTYSDEALANYINMYFYPVKFNAEGKDTVDFLGTIYKPTSSEPKAPHELAVKLLQGKLMYPTTLFMNGYDKTKNAFALNMLAAGYLDRPKIEPILVFTLENAYRNSTMDDFGAAFNKANADTSLMRKVNSMEWLKPDIAFNLANNKKKTIVQIYTNWCNSCKVMQLTTFTDSLNMEYLQEKFNLVQFNIEDRDSIRYQGKTYMNTGGFNQLAQVLTRNSLILPSTVILDDSLNIIDVISSYLPPVLFHDIIHFYGDNIFLKETWNKYSDSLHKKEEGSAKMPGNQ